MKKRIIFLIMMLLLATGCTCEYNLSIDNNIYKEQINIIGNSSTEIASLNNKWQIPIDKDEYKNIGGDPGTEIKINSDMYAYNLSGNKLIFNYDFTRSTLSTSSAISVCYNKATVSNYQNSIIISTSSKVNCFDTYPTLTSVKVNITTSKPVTNHNADSVNGNTYTWNLTRNNASDKAINMMIDNTTKDSTIDDNIDNEKVNIKNNKEDYTLYILCGILLIVFLTIYFIFNNLNKKNDY